jgi:signal transduction histidine kinase
VRSRRPLTHPIEATTYFLVSEALANVAKHAGASHASVDVRRGVDRLEIEVSDDGSGGASIEGGTGLRGLADRVAAVGGRMDLRSAPGAGTTVLAEIPCA